MEASPGSVDGLKIDYVPVKGLSILLMRPSTERFSYIHGPSTLARFSLVTKHVADETGPGATPMQ
jgi:hypothetical protein